MHLLLGSAKLYSVRCLGRSWHTSNEFVQHTHDANVDSSNRSGGTWDPPWVRDGQSVLGAGTHRVWSSDQWLLKRK